MPIADEDKAVDEAWGYQAKPADRRGLPDAAARPGRVVVPRHPHALADGREEMVMTVASNATQSHDQLLRHGMINWVTRGVYLGYPAQLPRAARRRPLPRRRLLGPGHEDDELRPGRGDPHERGRRRPGRRVVEGDRAPPRHGLQRRRRRAVQGRQRRQRPAARRGAAPTARTSAGSTTPGSTRTSTARRGRSSPTRSRATRPGRKTNGLGAVATRTELVTGEHSGLANTPSRQPGDDRPAAVHRRPRGDDRRHAACRGATSTASRPLSPHGETPASHGDGDGRPRRSAGAVDLSWTRLPRDRLPPLPRRAGTSTGG